jgi:Fur family ferric uptake transcriptional regulator
MEASDLLQKHGLSRTRNRVNILDALAHAARPLSVKEISGILPVRCDKSTIHRTLNSLFEKQIVQRIIVDHEVKYALGKKYNGKKGHQGDHVHFKCSVCNTLFCMEEIEVMDYTLPEGFEKEENQFLVIGRCNKCKR